MTLRKTLSHFFQNLADALGDKAEPQSFAARIDSVNTQLANKTLGDDVRHAMLDQMIKLTEEQKLLNITKQTTDHPNVFIRQHPDYAVGQFKRVCMLENKEMGYPSDFNDFMNTSTLFRREMN